MRDTERLPFETVDSAATWAKKILTKSNIPDARLESQLLLALALDVSRLSIIAGTCPPPDAVQQKRFIELVEARIRHIPFAYLRGTQEFYGLTFTVSHAVLIPRPETELLVDFALEKLSELKSAKRSVGVENSTDARHILNFADNEMMPLIADVGTGSGCIPIAVLANFPTVCAIASDISGDALAVARRNAAANEVVNRLRFVRTDLLSAVGETKFALIVSNPPYIPTAEIDTLQPEVRASEPRAALDGGSDGLDFYRRLIVQAVWTLLPGGWLAVEVGQGQAADVSALMECAGLSEIEIQNDLAGIARVVYGRRSF